MAQADERVISLGLVAKERRLRAQSGEAGIRKGNGTRGMGASGSLVELRVSRATYLNHGASVLMPPTLILFLPQTRMRR